MIKGIKILALVIALLPFWGCKMNQSTNLNPGMTLVWSDEFNNDGLPDSTKWGYDLGDGCPTLCGWGNGESQYYTANRKENARIEGGMLIVEAHKERKNKSEYTSAKLISKNKGDWTYGRIEARIQCPTGRGTWPAFWMMPTDWKYGGWPSSGEIDIMEHVGHNVDSVFGSAHTGNFNHIEHTGSTGGVFVPDAESAFHVYGINWTPDSINYQLDGKTYHTFKNTHKNSEDWPFDQRFHVILNLAVGGHWGGEKGIDDTIWPRKMLVDYVRAYQLTDKKG
jgi:beta-glucanase (GH16 family)